MKIERKLSALPKSIVILLFTLLLVQIGSTLVFKDSNEFEYKKLTQPAAINFYRLASLDSLKLMAHLLTIDLQLHDNQAGRYLSYRHLSYDLVSQWLTQLQQMNMNSEYPALLASRVFVNTRDKQQLRIILNTTIQLFENKPLLNWRWMAEGAIAAKYFLKDIPLALKMAQAIAKQPKQGVIPAWARDLEFIMLEKLNQLDTAIYVVEKSLQDGTTMSNDEKRFLEQRLLMLKQKRVENSTLIPKNVYNEESGL